MNWLALDIGGANVKVADGRGFARSYTFHLWKDSAGLAHKLRAILAESPAADHLAVTMTGELADCFTSKVDGVRFILDAVARGSDNRHTRVYLVDGRLVSPVVALQMPHLAAASNWRALAQFAGRFAPRGSALLMDVGSTTCDIIPLFDGQPVATGRTDTQRLIAGELIYTGVERSPVCAVISHAPYRGQSCPVTQELFATMLDVYVVLGSLPEDLSSQTTADGRPGTKSAAVARLGRMLAADASEFVEPDALVLAEAAAKAQAAILATAVRQVVAPMASPPEQVILSGHGDFLAISALHEAGVNSPRGSLSQYLDSSVARVGPAHALAVLARESGEK
jgi:(4-(4-[2-(gamma-L-glutamylamino)ethyl]phenoxymethyl)furan-2-yl)methanamine synthase